MAHLIYYRQEYELFKEEHEKNLNSTEECRIVIKKLLRHFKLGEPRISFTSGRNHSCAGRWEITINTNQMNFAVLCHELAHVYQAKRDGFKSGDKWHTKRHRRIMKRILNYCQKKGWFESELKRRIEPKPEKPEPTKDELRQKKIQRLEQSTKKCLSKIKRYQNSIKKNHRRIGSLKRFILIWGASMD